MRPTAVLCVLAGVLALALPAHGDDTRVADAVGAYRALAADFVRGPLLREDAARPDAATAWPTSQALAATLAVAEVSPPLKVDVRTALARLAPYWSRDERAFASHALPPLGRGGSTFVDDNEWLALDLVRAHRLLGTNAPLERARMLYRLVAGAWDVDESHACPGGVFWSTDPSIRDRNTVSTANGALLALELWRETGRRGYVRDALRMMRWLDRCEFLADGLYGDHIDLAGRRNDREWTYNQGAVIAVQTLLAQATGDTSRLRRAQRLADRATRRFGSTFAGEPPEFVAIFLDDLRMLDAADGGRRFAALAPAYVRGFDVTQTSLLARAARVRLLAEIANSYASR
jgi:hypothetical protein